MDSPHQIDIIAQLVGIIRAERNTLIGVARREGIAAEDALDCVQDAFCCFLRLAITQTLPENP